MEEIARGYGVPYIPRLPMDYDSGDSPDGGLAVRNSTSFPKIQLTHIVHQEPLMPALERKHSEMVAPILTDPVGATTERVAAKLPQIPPAEGTSTPNVEAPGPSKPAPPAEDEFEALKRRLDALKVRK
jgi:hypothetical protein